MKDDLKRDVAKFLGKLNVVAGIDCIADFVGLLDHILLEGRMGLLAVPRAPARIEESFHQNSQARDGIGDGFDGGAIEITRFERLRRFDLGRLIQWNSLSSVAESRR